MNSITRRWVRGSLLITLIVMLLAEAVFLYFSISTAYDGARRALQMRENTILTQMSATDTQTEAGRSVVLRRMLEQFAEKDKFEVMLLNAYGQIAASTTGYVPAQNEVPADYIAALAAENGVGESVYKTAMGEKVMAITALLPSTTDEIVAVRIATSLVLLDKNILNIIVASVAVVLAIISFSVWSGMFFVRSIVRPIGEIEQTAAKIAEGNLDIRIENKYNDEIGKLSDTINHMAGELDKTERMKNDFISSVSHELRTPLTSIKSWMETIAQIPDTNDENYRRGIQVITNETDRLYAMVEELLDFSRMQNGLTLDNHLIDLVAEVSDTALMVQKRIQLEGLQLHYDEPELPVPIMGDSARLRQVFINILDNAVKYSPKGGTVGIEILCDTRNAFVNISDGGKGISPEDLENVKVKFYKGKGAVRGSGIGLAVVDEIVTAHGGGLEIQSEMGKGTIITVRLPLYQKGTQTIETT
ncbi:MAG: HAMP domain-containing sensor histidine kinase [Ruthenibacterium sp.]